MLFKKSKNSYEYEKTENGVRLRKYLGDDVDAFIPRKYKGCPVTELLRTFADCTRLKSVVIPDGVTEIGRETFAGCVGLTDITIPDGVTEIGDGAFDQCRALKSITLPDSVTCIRDYAFSACESLQCVNIPAGVTELGLCPFAWCGSLADFTVSPDNEHFTAADGVLMSEDGKKLIAYPAGKKGEVLIPDGTTSIGEFAFCRSSNLTSVTIPAGVETVGWGAFDGCSDLSSLTISEGVQYINDYAFAHCINLPDVTIPASVSSIGECAFEGCDNLTDITVMPDSENYTSVGGVLMSKDRKTLVEFPAGRSGEYRVPAGIEAIGNCAFMSVKKIAAVILPNSVTSIGIEAFEFSEIKSITVPDSVTSIGGGAFDECDGLTVYCSEGSFAAQYCEKKDIHHEPIK